MNGRLVAAIAVFALGVSAAAQQPYRTRTTSVLVDVSVRQGGRAVNGLTAANFRLTDNRVAQTLVEVSRERLPVDVSLVLDLAGSVEGPLLDSLRRAIETVMTGLRDQDRATLVAFDEHIRQLKGVEGRTLRISTDQLASNGTGVLLDALAASLVRLEEPARRPMAVVFTDGKDAGSFLDEREVLDVASRSGTTVFVVAVTDGTKRVPQQPTNPGFLRALADSTGGTLAVVQRDADLGESFSQAVEEFRTSYVLRYTPTGVTAPGWHDLLVTVTPRGNYEVRARKGYFDAASR